ncbi:uncharacterized protein MONBRDRAFT_22782, partial [Monosiga brevicollis MX1]
MGKQIKLSSFFKAKALAKSGSSANDGAPPTKTKKVNTDSLNALAHSTSKSESSPTRKKDAPSALVTPPSAKPQVEQTPPQRRVAAVPSTGSPKTPKSEVLAQPRTPKRSKRQSEGTASPASQPTASPAPQVDDLDNLRRESLTPATASTDDASSLQAQLPELLALPAARRQQRVRQVLMAQARSAKLTPLEKQFVDIKCQHPDALLLLEVGYKYQLFGEDAAIAAKILSIYCAYGHNNFNSASIPVPRLFVHMRRLVAAGYKVGVAKQTETAALKKAGDNKSKLFTREIHALYTQATLVGEDCGDDFDEDGINDQNNLVCLLEADHNKAASGLQNTADNAPAADETAEQTLALFCVSCSTGRLVHDQFSDDLARSQLNTRLTHLEPVEILVPANLSARTKKVIAAYCELQRVRVRVETMPVDRYGAVGASDRVRAFYARGTTPAGPASDASLTALLDLPPLSVRCAAALFGHLEEFRLDNSIHMAASLDKFVAERSLLWALDQTKSPFGRRCLRKWLCHPLIKPSEIRARHDAIAYLLTEPMELQGLLQTLAASPDLERIATSILHERAKPSDVVKALQTIDAVATATEVLMAPAVASTLPALVHQAIEAMHRHFGVVRTFLFKLNVASAVKNDKATMFAEDTYFPDQEQLHETVRKIHHDIDGHLLDLRKLLKQPDLEYRSVSGEEYLIEVKNKEVGRIPHDWLKISATKTMSRYRSPFIQHNLELRAQTQERLTLGANEAWMRFMRDLNQHFDVIMAGIGHLAMLDCLQSLTNVAQRDGYCRPEIVDEGSVLEIEAGRHPVSELLSARQYVSNGCHLKVAMIAIMAQLGSYVPATKARLSPLDAIFTRMGAGDAIFQAQSTFQLELKEASDALATASPRSLVIFDELGRGTSTHDGLAIAYATLKHLVTRVRCLSLFVTHYTALAELATAFPEHVRCYHMAFLQEDEDGPNDHISFLYQLRQGLAARSYGLNVARLAQLPSTLLQRAGVKSEELEQEVAQKRLGGIKIHSLLRDHNHPALSSMYGINAAIMRDNAEIITLIVLITVETFEEDYERAFATSVNTYKLETRRHIERRCSAKVVEMILFGKRVEMSTTAMDTAGDVKVTDKMSWWLQNLEPTAKMQLPTDYPRSASGAYQYAEAEEILDLPENVCRALLQYSMQEQVQPFSIIFATVAILMHKYTREECLPIGTSSSTFNPLVLRVDLIGEMQLREVVHKVLEAEQTAVQHEVPFSDLLQSITAARAGAGSINPNTDGESPFPVADAKRLLPLRLRLVYNSVLFARPRIQATLSQIESVALRIVKAPETTLQACSLATHRDTNVLPDPNKRLDDTWEGPAFSFLSKHATRTPERPLLVHGDVVYTYKQVDELSNRLAHYLVNNGIQKEERVALYAHRSSALVVGIMGILKSGATFTVIDPAYPIERQTVYLEVAQPRGIVSLAAAGPIGEEVQAYIDKELNLRCQLNGLAMEGDLGPLEGESTAPVGVEVGPDNIGTLSFTSG